MPPEAHPVAAIHGRTSKIKRYYWRELHKREMEIFGKWALDHGVDPVVASGPDAASVHKLASMQAPVRSNTCMKLHLSTCFTTKKRWLTLLPNATWR